MNAILSVHWALIAAIWYTANGILHDVFVIINHKGGYNRDLLRLLMDGHVLVFSGLVLFVCYWMLLQKIPYAALIAAIIALSLLVYCGMIWPFLKSMVTVVISGMLLAASVNAWVSFSGTAALK
ncbi:MAG: hypothetical protein ACXVPQ_07765 [Bacteroidia bacterium]